MRGVFTRAAGSMERGRICRRCRVPAHCLLWLDESSDVPWTFLAENPQVLAPGLWLAFSP